MTLEHSAGVKFKCIHDSPTAADEEVLFPGVRVGWLVFCVSVGLPT